MTSENIAAYIRSIVRRKEGQHINPTIINEALKGIRMPMSVSDPEARILEFMQNIFYRLDVVGYGDFRKRNPEKMLN